VLGRFSFHWSAPVHDSGQPPVSSAHGVVDLDLELGARSATPAFYPSGRTGKLAITTTDANEPVADIHDRMPVIPRDLMRSFPADLMRM
jgi:hypothetical protein